MKEHKGDRSGYDRRQEPRQDAVERRVGERVLPHSIESERGVLGSILINPDVINLLPDGFDGSVFYREAHRLIYNAIKSLRDQGTEIDLLTVKEEMRRLGTLDDAEIGRAHV